jgi:hypothetical protein
MAQAINDIQSEILQTAAASAELPAIDVLTDDEKNTLGNVDSTSKVGVFRLLVYVMAVAMWVQQKLNDIFRGDIEERIAATRPFTQRWYVSTSLAYQHGYNLDDEGNYPVPTSVAEQQAADAAKIVSKAAVVQTIIAGVGALRIKVAKLQGELLAPLSGAELAGFQEYIELMGAAGIYVVATTAEADKLMLNYKIYFDPLILDNEGKRLDGTNDTPVKDAVKSYLKSVEFNGVLSLVKLTDVIQQVDGVTDPFLQAAASKYAAYNYGDSNSVGNVGAITEFRRPDSGYFHLDEGASQFTFIPN